MSSPQMVPMIYKDGSIGDIPSDRVPEALQSGFRHGVNVISKDGLKGTIPIERIPEALQQGMMPEHAMVPRRPMQSSYGWEDLKNDIATIGGDFNQFLKPSGQAPSGYPNVQYQSPSAMRQGTLSEGPDLKGQAAFQAGLEDAKRKAAGYNPVYRAAVPVAQAIGTNVSGMEQSAAAGDAKGVLLHTVAPATMGMAAAGAFRDVGPQVDATPAISELATGELPPNRPQLTPQEFAQKITNAAQIPPKQIPAFEKNVTSQYDNLIDAAGGNTPKGIKPLTDMVRASADAKRAHYYNNVLAPHADIPRGVESVPNYAGETVSPNQATLGMLDKRLSNINKQLYGAYERGGGQNAATQAALSIGDKLSLEAESQGIRKVLNQELAARNGMTIDQVSQMRSDFGQLGNIADKLELSFNKARFANNQKANQPSNITLNPLSREKSFLLTAPIDKGINAAANAIKNRFYSPDAMIRQAFKNQFRDRSK